MRKCNSRFDGEYKKYVPLEHRTAVFMFEQRQAGPVYIQPAKMFVGAAAPNPIKLKNSRPRGREFFQRRALAGAYLSPRSRRWFSDFSSPMSISTLCRCTNNSRCSSRIARYSA